MARKRKHKKRKHHRRKKHSSVGRRAKKYYVSVKRNKKYHKKRKRKSHAGHQTTMFGPRYRVVHKVKRIGRRHRHKSHGMGAVQGAGAWTGAHNAIC